MNRINNAVNNFEKGYNCSQAVFLAYANKYGLSEDIALKMASSFGGGMGRLREVCGAVTAMFAIAGLEKGYIEYDNDDIKAEHYQFIQLLAEKFKEEHASLICRELLGLEKGKISSTPTKRTEEFYNTRPCADFIKTASNIIEEYILK